MEHGTKTPWQKVHARFGMTSAQLARALGRHRSKISRAMNSQEGLINGPDQKLILKAAETLKVDLRPSDLLPGA